MVGLRVLAGLWEPRPTDNPQGSSFRVQPSLSKDVKHILTLKRFTSRAGDIAHSVVEHLPSVQEALTSTPWTTHSLSLHLSPLH